MRYLWFFFFFFLFFFQCIAQKKNQSHIGFGIETYTTHDKLFVEQTDYDRYWLTNEKHINYAINAVYTLDGKRTQLNLKLGALLQENIFSASNSHHMYYNSSGYGYYITHFYGKTINYNGYTILLNTSLGTSINIIPLNSKMKFGPLLSFNPQIELFSKARSIEAFDFTYYDLSFIPNKPVYGNVQESHIETYTPSTVLDSEIEINQKTKKVFSMYQPRLGYFVSYDFPKIRFYSDFGIYIADRYCFKAFEYGVSALQVTSSIGLLFRIDSKDKDEND